MENDMDKENIEKIEELLDDSLETLADKKRFAKTMNTIIKDCAKKNEIEPKVIKAVKNYRHYRGANWVNNNPLENELPLQSFCFSSSDGNIRSYCRLWRNTQSRREVV